MWQRVCDKRVTQQGDTDMWHGCISKDGTQIYAKGKPLESVAHTMITAKTRKELFAKLDKAQREAGH